MKILSLFDGMSCGRIALERAGIEIDAYFASEIDRHAITVTQSNYPDTIQLGDVTTLSANQLPRIDLLMGGSPCQGLSSVGEGRGLDDPRSRLFWEFVRLLEECQPRFFLLENVPMRKDWLAIITAALGVEHIRIDSALVSAQHRQRLYWTNTPGVTQPEDLGITLDDVIENTGEYRPIGKWTHRVPSDLPKYVDPYNRKAITRGKASTLRTNLGNGNMWIRAGAGYRQLLVSECEKLQTVPVGYTDAVAMTNAKKMLGNGWTVDVIAHILSCM